jgi:hypothetical protein
LRAQNITQPTDLSQWVPVILLPSKGKALADGENNIICPVQLDSADQYFETLKLLFCLLFLGWPMGDSDIILRGALGFYGGQCALLLFPYLFPGFILFSAFHQYTHNLSWNSNVYSTLAI